MHSLCVCVWCGSGDEADLLMSIMIKAFEDFRNYKLTLTLVQPARPLLVSGRSHIALLLPSHRREDHTQLGMATNPMICISSASEIQLKPIIQPVRLPESHIIEF